MKLFLAFVACAVIGCGGPMASADGGYGASGGDSGGCVGHPAPAPENTIALYQPCATYADCVGGGGGANCNYAHPSPWPMNYASGVGICTIGCATDADCPNGGVCLEEGNASAGFIHTCVAPCSNGACPTYQECVPWNGHTICASAICSR